MHRKKIFIILPIIALCVAGMVGYQIYTRMEMKNRARQQHDSENVVLREIGKAGYCRESSDCIRLSGFGYPFNCRLINKSETEHITQIAQSYFNTFGKEADADCNTFSVVCENNVCTTDTPFLMI